MAIQNNFPAIRPSLNLDFANTKTLDSRITFTRASTATYYDGKTTAKAEENLILQSQNFGTTWAAASATLTSGITDPAGTATAFTVTASGANGTLLQTFTAAATAYTFSIFIQRVTGTGNIDITVDGTTYATQTTTGTWTRFTITTTPTAGSRTCGVRVATSGDAVNIAFAQLEQRSTVTAYTPTTTQPITNYIPVLLTAPSDVARFEHNPITGESLGLEIEEQRTNLLTYSEQFDNAAWAKQNSATAIPNTIIAPDGTLNGDTLTRTTAQNAGVVQGATSTAAVVYCGSVFVKAGTLTSISLALTNSNSTTVIARGYVNLITGAITNTTGTGLLPAVNVGNDWWRVSIQGAAIDAQTRFIIYAGIFNGAIAGDNYIWGAQLEAGSFATSYIPTVASQVTRAADSASMTGTNFSSWYRADEGTVYAEALSPSASGFFFASTISDGTANNEIRLGSQSGGGNYQLVVNVAGVTQVSATAQSAASAIAYKISGAYKVNDFATSSNGAAVATDTSGLLPIVTQLTIGARGNNTLYLNGTIKRLTYYPKRLSNTQLQAITS